MSPAPFKVTSIAQYKLELAARHVVLSSTKREEIFLKSAQEKLAKIGAVLRIDHDLMATVRNLMEYPFVILGCFEERYLTIPKEILISEMKTHQKCFAVYDKKGELLPNFICSAAVLPYDEEVFAKGNARVLRARFEDGAFYFAEDQKKTLQQHAELLKTVTFERDLGTIAEKSDRIVHVANELALRFALTPVEMRVIEHAAPLVKADLTSGVVGQFPELQGIMGRIYALRENLDGDVAECIETHYWPRFAEDQLPRLKTAALLSIADKLDTLVGIVAIGKKPSGNKDPFALRRAAIGIVRMIVQFGFSIDLESLIRISLTSYGERFHTRAQEIIIEAKDFIIQRARGLLIDDLGKGSKDYAVNFADSVIAVGTTDVLDIFARAHTLFAMRNQSKQDFDSLVQAFKRASNIVKKATGAGEKIADVVHDEYLQARVERDLLKAVREVALLSSRPQHGDLALLSKAYVEEFSQIAKIKPKLDAFFDGVMVMVDEPTLRHARLALLSEIKRAADRIADFTHL
jgi:glycyl-tRNA synthetase beta chain